MRSRAAQRAAVRQAEANGRFKASEGKFLDKYRMDRLLGQGAFGSVYLCTRLSDDEKFAVKLVDRVLAPPADLQREVDMLDKLAHPTVVKMYETFNELCFVNIVLKLYPGGDMIAAMQALWKKMMIPINKAQFLVKQVLSSIAWVHSQSCVHRDIKGDNYMLEKPELLDPEQRIVLSDFGCVREVTEGERMTSVCGTKNFWSPEFYKKNYGVKVDVWAAGVLVFGIFSAKFPFKDEIAVRTGKPNVPIRVPEQGKDFLLQLLEKDESKRPSAEEALQHPYISSTALPPDPEAPPQPLEEVELKERGADAGVRERRRELVERLQHAHDSALRGEASHATLKLTQVEEQSFVVRDVAAERTTKYEWFSAQNAHEIVSAFGSAREMPDADRNTEVCEESVRKLLVDHSISLEEFGKGQGKPFSEFVAELQSGHSRLLLDATKCKCLVRVVNVVVLRIILVTGGERKYLIETSEKYPDGRVREDTNRMPGNPRAPHENAIQTANRLCEEMLKIADARIKFDFTDIECFEQDKDSPSYPGVHSVYQKEIVTGTVTTKDSGVLERLGGRGDRPRGFAAEGANGYARTYTWLSEAECVAKGIKLRLPHQPDAISALVYPPIGLDVDELNEFLGQNHIDVSKWGTGTYRSLREFSEELVKGEASLIKQADGRIMRVVDIVILKVVKPSGEVLVEVEETYRENSKAHRRLPALKRRSDEHTLSAARRLVTKILQIDENFVNIDPSGVKIIEEEGESTSYHGLTTLYRKRFLHAALLSSFAM